MKIYNLYYILVSAAIAVMLVCDCLAFATVDIFGHRLAASGFVFSLGFLILSVITNSYGYKLAGRVIWTMMGAQLFFIITINCVIFFEPS
jgi:uncharacterized PurR-regulated membrane protein YhhQ (DUF165 family)